METYRLFIKDVVATGDLREVRSPYNGEPIAKFERANRPALEQALANAEAYFHSVMKGMPAYKRAEILYKVSEQMRGRHEELALTIAREGGKPLKDARVEVSRAINTTKMSGDEALNLNGQTLSMDRSAGTENHLAFTYRHAKGPVLAISAFNHPLNLICHQVCTAIAAGCSVVVKPASQTPISCLKIAEIFRTAGLADGVLNVATAAGAEADLLVQDRRIKFVSFIGGEDVGWEIQKKVYPGVEVALEHGGTGTAIVEASADLSRTIPSLVRGGYYHAGQVCVSTQIVYVHRDLFDDVVRKLKEGVEKLKTGDPTDAATDVGPLITSKDVERIHSWVKEAEKQGAKIITGGEILEHNCYKPTLLTKTTKGMKVVKNEIFGPVLCVQSYTNLEQCIEEMNQSEYSFQAAIYTKDIDLAVSSARKIECKACMINDSTAFRVDWMPFGGTKRSGLKTGGIRNSILDMTDEKLVVARIEG